MRNEKRHSTQNKSTKLTESSVRGDLYCSCNVVEEKTKRGRPKTSMVYVYVRTKFWQIKANEWVDGCRGWDVGVARDVG